MRFVLKFEGDKEICLFDGKFSSQKNKKNTIYGGLRYSEDTYEPYCVYYSIFDNIEKQQLEILPNSFFNIKTDEYNINLDGSIILKFTNDGFIISTERYLKYFVEIKNNEWFMYNNLLNEFK